jgi:hypothetical protein
VISGIFKTEIIVIPISVKSNKSIDKEKEVKAEDENILCDLESSRENIKLFGKYHNLPAELPAE